MRSSIRSWYSCCSCFRFWTEMESHRCILSSWAPLPGVISLLPTPEVTVALKLVFIITIYVLCCYYIWLDHGFKWHVLYECHIIWIILQLAFFCSTMYFWLNEVVTYMYSAAAAKTLQSCPTLCNPIDAAHQAPLSLGFSRQEHWSGLPCPSPYMYSSSFLSAML